MDQEIPQKRGTFIEFRNGMLNVSLIGRNCSQEERDNFEKFDQTANVRKTMVETLKKEFADYGFGYVFHQVGRCSTSFRMDGIRHIRYNLSKRMGSKRFISLAIRRTKGGMITEIFESAKTIGHTVTSPEDTVKQVTESIINV